MRGKYSYHCAIVEKSLESGDLTEAQHVGDSVKASTLDFGPLVAM